MKGKPKLHILYEYQLNTYLREGGGGGGYQPIYLGSFDFELAV